MDLRQLASIPEIQKDKKLQKAYVQCESLLKALAEQEIPNDMVAQLNKEIEGVNNTNLEGKALKKHIRKTQAGIVKVVVKDLKLVPVNYYRNMWLGIGIALGVALGSVIGTSSGNMSFTGIGLPIGLAFGITYGTSLDKKAKDEGRQLGVEIK